MTKRNVESDPQAYEDFEVAVVEAIEAQGYPVPEDSESDAGKAFFDDILGAYGTGMSKDETVQLIVAGFEDEADAEAASSVIDEVMVSQDNTVAEADAEATDEADAEATDEADAEATDEADAEADAEATDEAKPHDTVDKQAQKAEKSADIKAQMKRLEEGLTWTRDDLRQEFEAEYDDKQMVAIIPAEREAIWQGAKGADISLFARMSRLAFNEAALTVSRKRGQGSNEIEPHHILKDVRDWLKKALLYGYEELDDGRVEPVTLGRDQRLPTLDNYIPLAAKCSVLASEGYVQLTPWHLRLDRPIAPDELSSTDPELVVQVPTYKRGLCQTMQRDDEATKRAGKNAQPVHNLLTEAQAAMPYRATDKAIRELWMVYIEGPSTGKAYSFSPTGVYESPSSKTGKGKSKAKKISASGIGEVAAMVPEIMEREAANPDQEHGTLKPGDWASIFKAAASVIHNADIENHKEPGMLDAFFSLALEVNSLLGNIPQLGEGFQAYKKNVEAERKSAHDKRNKEYETLQRIGKAS